MVNKADTVKKWYESKTLWMNLIVILIGVLQWVSGEISAGVAITALGLLNAVLRTITKHKIQF